MGGQVNTFFGQLSDQQAPCIADTSASGSFSTCLVWLVLGLVIGSIAFDKKKKESA